MLRIKRHEVVVYSAVKSGDLEIDAEGRTWRIRRKVRSGGGFVSRPCRRVRAESGSKPARVVEVRIGGRSYTTSASMLIWLHFNGPIPPGMQVMHLNGKRDDNRPSNLALATPSDLQVHRLRVHGSKNWARNQRGEKNRSAKLTAAKVRKIRAARSRGVPGVDLSERYGVSQGTVSSICSGRIWGHVK